MTPEDNNILFSRCNGLVSSSASQSISAISPELQADLINALLYVYPGRFAGDEAIRQCSDLAVDVWAHFLHEPINDPPRIICGRCSTVLLDRVLGVATHKFNGKPAWWLYDLLEFVAANPHAQYGRTLLHEQVNQALDRNFAAARMTDGLMTPIADEHHHSIPATESQPPQCFISYSWDSQQHKEWVRKLAEALTAHHVGAVLDQWEVQPRTDLAHFMEKASRTDFVVVV
jgi:hypothetical protein